MAYLDHHEAFEDFKNRALEGIKAHFPVDGRDQALVLKGLEVRHEKSDSDDIQGQHAAKVSGSTFSRPVYATLALVDKKTGKEGPAQTMKVAEIPLMTRRYSYIVGGQEYQVDNQWQLKPGAYVRRGQSGEIETAFNVVNKPDLDIKFDPEKKVFLLERGKSKSIPAYPILKALGVDDDTLEHQWGKDILQANKEARGGKTALEKFYKADKKVAPPDAHAAAAYVVDVLSKSTIRPEATELTLGKPFKTVEPDAIVRATKKMLDVHAGAPEDDRDSLIFKNLRSIGDYAYDKLTHWKTVNSVRAKMLRQINTAKTPRDVVRGEFFNKPLMDTFKKNSAARTADQINPAEMLDSSMQTTIMGPGGIQSEDQITNNVRFVNQSHFGFLDTLNTPEGSKVGVALHLPMGVKKVGNEARIPVYNLKTGQRELVNAATFVKSRVVMPDQMTWTNGKPTPVASKVKILGKDNDLEELPASEAHYAMYHPSQVYSVASNLIPFMGNDSGNRASFATHHLKQAISLVNRDVPLIQVGTGSEKSGIRSFEEMLGKQASHASPVDGTVHSVSKNAIVIAGADGKKRALPLYNNYPLNDAKSVMHSTPLEGIVPGAKVKAGQLLADTNFTKNGTLALGKNLRVGYLPYKGYNFEDGVVISGSASEALTSKHLHKPTLKLLETDVSIPRKFIIQHPEAYKKEQYEKLDENGHIKVGTRVHDGDPLVLATRAVQITDRSGIAGIRKSLAGQHTDVSLKWDNEHSGIVTGVFKRKDGTVSVHVSTEEPMQVGDKITGRHGNKGIVTRVIPDAEMPHTKDGKPLQVLLNPSGVPGRMNVGQILETVMSKVAKKTGQPIVINNFEHGVNQLERAKEELKKHGLTDTEEVIDPATGKSLGQVLVGNQYMLKLHHQVDKKLTARSGMSLKGEPMEAYDINLIPASGGKSGGMSLGSLGLNVLLAHGATANIREMQTWKSQGPDPAAEGKKWPSQHHEVWNAIQLGQPLPTPTPTFAFHKFTEMLKAAGINYQKTGHKMELSPLTDKDILKMSHGELHAPSRLTYAKTGADGNLKPLPGGLFDEKITGGVGGKKWSHFKLAEPMPNPVFEVPIQKVLGITSTQFHKIVSGEMALDKGGKVVELGHGETGGVAIANALKRLDTDTELKKARKELAEAPVPHGFAHGAATQQLDQAFKKVKYLQLLSRKGISPGEAYVLHNVPVLPPGMRPPSIMADGNVKWEDLNGLYSSLAQNNSQLHELKSKAHLGIGDRDLKEHREALYDGMRALVGIGQSSAEKDGAIKGVLSIIHGTAPKYGYFQKTLLGRRQDMTMRSTIVPEVSMGIDHVGIPEDKALKLFRPFVVKKMVERGVAPDPLTAQDMLAKKDAPKNKGIMGALDSVMQERPILMKRDPALHMHNIQAFIGQRVKGKAINIHPLVTGGYGADFDGDAMNIYVPISEDAVAEARNMMPSKHLFNPSTGRVAFTPSLDAAVGLYRLSLTGKDSNKSFHSPAEVLKAAQQGDIQHDQLVKLPGGKTTAGRVLIASALPTAMHNKILYDHDYTLDADNVTKLHSELAHDHPKEFADASNKLKDFGFEASYGLVKLRHPEKHVGAGAIAAAEDPKHMQHISVGTATLSLADLTPDIATRDRIAAAAKLKVEAVNKMDLTKTQKDERAIEIWQKAGNEMKKEHLAEARKTPNALLRMYEAGSKPGWGAYKQLRMAPVLYEASGGGLMPTPVLKSYSEGLDMTDYWLQSGGARWGIMQRSRETRDPGFFSKQLVNTTMNLQVTTPDCGTHRGIGLSVSADHVHDRELAADVNVKGTVFKKGTVLSPDVVAQLRKLDKNAQVVVRSSLKCENEEGLCQKCVGISPDGKHYELGTNIGVIAAQALGERSVQLPMKAFHTGGASGGGGGVLGAFTRTQQLTLLPKDIPNASVLAMKSGTVTKMEHDRTGTHVWVDDVKHFIPFDRAGRHLTKSLEGISPASWAPPAVGAKVEAGYSLSDPARTVVNPHDLYRATGNIEKVQNFITNELHGIYSSEGVRRQHIETVVKAMSNLTRVRDSGDAEGILKGEYQPTSKIRALNAQLEKEGKHPVSHSPIMKGIDVLPRVLHDDWMAKLNYDRLTQTITDGAAEGAVSNLHGLHPVPGIAHGAEMGLARKLVKPKNLEHLPKWAY